MRSLASESTVSPVSLPAPKACRNRPGGARRWLFPLVMLLLSVLALPLDVPTARFFMHGRYPGVLREVFENAEPFGHAFGVVIVLLAIWFLDPARRGALPRFLAASLGAGLTADVIKLLVSRSRPRSFDLVAGTVGETFNGLLPIVHHAGSSQQSFPSAHTTTAVALAVMLTHYYPRGRWLFTLLALLAACHRVQSGAHFISDTCVGAALGWFVATNYLSLPRIARWFDRWERPAKAPALTVIDDQQQSAA